MLKGGGGCGLSPETDSVTVKEGAAGVSRSSGGLGESQDLLRAEAVFAGNGGRMHEWSGGWGAWGRNGADGYDGSSTRRGWDVCPSIRALGLCLLG